MTSGNRITIGKLVVWFLVGLAAIVLFKLVLRLLGIAWGLATFLLFTVGPILVVGWLVWLAVRFLKKTPPDRPGG